MLKCTINGQEVEVEEGSTVIEAFMKADQQIAHYCWHPGLSIAGVCRMCMVEIEGNPRLQIGCNTTVQDGMVVRNDSEKVKEAVEWTLKFHLINHPLDCPICDQAGECGLQEYYMSHGEYDSEMAERKVKKRKVVDLGKNVVLDSERCILCSRCVRFTDEVSKTNELGIFSRGDHSEIGTFKDRPLNNKYSVNTVDICPVGALTSKDFRFRQRVWFLKDFETVCNGCSAGCNVKVHYNENGLYRVKPVYNKEVNGHWMCDDGRDLYKYVNLESRLVHAVHQVDGARESLRSVNAVKQAGDEIKALAQKEGKDSVALVLTGQYTTEEYEAITESFTKTFNSDQVFHWINNPESFEDFDGLLIRGDKNPNTSGLLQTLESKGLKKSWNDLEGALNSGKIKGLVVAAPENQSVYPDLEEKVNLFSQAEKVVWLTPGKNRNYEKFEWQVPVKSFVEKNGTFINHKGQKQMVKSGTTIVKEALTLEDVAILFLGQKLPAPQRPVTVSLGGIQ